MMFYSPVIISLPVTCILSIILPEYANTGIVRPRWEKGTGLWAPQPARSLAHSGSSVEDCRTTEWCLNAFSALCPSPCLADWLVFHSFFFCVLAFVLTSPSSQGLWALPRNLSLWLGLCSLLTVIFLKPSTAFHLVAAWHCWAHPVFVSTQVVSSLQINIVDSSKCGVCVIRKHITVRVFLGLWCFLMCLLYSWTVNGHLSPAQSSGGHDISTVGLQFIGSEFSQHDLKLLLRSF